MAEAGRLEVRPRNAESPAKAWLSGERLKGFEPSTFCMASRTCSPDSVRKVAGNSGFPRYRRGVGFPGFHWETTGLGHRMGTRAGLVGVGGFEPRSRDHEGERAGTAARSSQDKDLPANLEWVYGEGGWRRSPSVPRLSTPGRRRPAGEWGGRTRTRGVAGPVYLLPGERLRETGAARNAELAVDVRQVNLDRFRGHVQRVGDVAVALPLRREVGDAPLARGQRFGAGECLAARAASRGVEL